MRVLYDGTIYSMQAAGGINRYFSNVIRLLPDDVEPVLVSEVRREVNFPASANVELHCRNRIAWHRPFRGLGLRIQRRRLQRVARKIEADLLHPTYYALLPGLDSLAERLPVVVTVYDMIDERFPELLDPTGELAARKRRMVERARAVICISNSTKADLMETCGVPEEKISVVPLASELGSVQPSGKEIAPRTPFFLHVGARWPYKNFPGLLSAFRLVADRTPDVKLCVAGHEFSKTELELIDELGLAQRVSHLGLCSDADLARYYESSIALVSASLAEGFGIPFVEAMGCGTPVVAANTTAIPEVVGDAGLLVDPTSAEELASALTRLLESPSLRDELAARGRERARLFSWERTVAETLKVYRSVVASPSSAR